MRPTGFCRGDEAAVPLRLIRSCRHRAILVDEATKHVVTVDAMERRGSAADLTGGYFKIDSTVRAPSVVMADVLAKFPFEVTVVQNEQPVEAFGAHGPHPALCVGIGPGRSDWRLDHPDALGAKHLVEAGRELGVPIPDQEGAGADADAPAGPAAARTVDPARLMEGANTLYVCAPAHDQRRLAPLFVSVVREVVEHVYDRVTRTGRPLDPPLLVVLDEAANIAPLSDLDALASTAAGHGVQLVTVWHDLAQISARYGPRATTVVNNHRAKLFLSGISDPSTLDYASHLVGEEEVLLPSTTHGGRGGASTTRSPSMRRLAPPDALRRIAPGEGVLVYGDLPPARLRLRTWFDDPWLLARAGPPGGASR